MTASPATRKTSLLMCWIALGLLTLTSSQVLAANLGQATGEAMECPLGAPRFGPEDWKVAANRWQLTPGVATTQGDTVNATERAARNAFWERWLEIVPAGPPLVDYDYRPSVDPVFDKANSIVWVLGTFKSFHAYTAGSKANHIYTEMNILAETVVFDPRARRVAPGTLIDITLLGGCLKNPEGKITESMVWPKRFSMKPGKRYLMALFPRDVGSYTLWSDWEIANGRILPSSPVDEVQVKEGKSELVGLPVEAAVEFIQKTLGTQ